jgi:putative PIN family toxin of toxin-antitoxin system
MTTKRVILDTNVCLDLFVFRDKHLDKLLVALQNGEVEAVTRKDCRNEWLRVLDYPNLPLEIESRRESAAAFDELITCITPEALIAVVLPICSDSDDQKFLELARDANAEYLITKDKALLKLARKTSIAGLFKIMQPNVWIKNWQSGQ